jgi:hypothetical protein
MRSCASGSLRKSGGEPMKNLRIKDVLITGLNTSFVRDEKLQYSWQICE